MFDFKLWVANKIVKPFKSFPFFGRQRFWFLYWCYRITCWHVRSKEWDFVLEYLPKLGKWQEVDVLDVGCSRNLLCYEVKARGYYLNGIDLEEPGFKYPARFLKYDITKGFPYHSCDFVTCISVLEHIEDRKNAVYNMGRCLKPGGRLLITIPTKEFAQGHEWEGFTYTSFKDLLPSYMEIIEYTERAGQLCMAIERTA